jgi:hypothetical protein
MGRTRAELKWRHFEGEIILWAVRWYCRYGISYRGLEAHELAFAYFAGVFRVSERVNEFETVGVRV